MAASLAFLSDGIRIASNSAMIEITTKSSISVKALRLHIAVTPYADIWSPNYKMRKTELMFQHFCTFNSILTAIAANIVYNESNSLAMPKPVPQCTVSEWPIYP